MIYMLNRLTIDYNIATFDGSIRGLTQKRLTINSYAKYVQTEKLGCGSVRNAKIWKAFHWKSCAVLFAKRFVSGRFIAIMSHQKTPRRKLIVLLTVKKLEEERLKAADSQ